MARSSGVHIRQGPIGVFYQKGNPKDTVTSLGFIQGSPVPSEEEEGKLREAFTSLKL